MAPPDLPDPAAAPDARPRTDSPAARRRTVLFTAIGAVLAAALLFAIVARAMSTDPGSSGDGGQRATVFEVGPAERLVATVARDGPLLFPDPRGGTRDIFVQHLGEKNWVAFEARVSGAPRQCALEWEASARHFVDPCDGRIFPADGAGLVSFPTTVDDDGRVIVDLGSPRSPQPSGATTLAP